MRDDFFSKVVCEFVCVGGGLLLLQAVQDKNPWTPHVKSLRSTRYVEQPDDLSSQSLGHLRIAPGLLPCAALSLTLATLTSSGCVGR